MQTFDGERFHFAAQAVELLTARSVEKSEKHEFFKNSTKGGKLARHASSRFVTLFGGPIRVATRFDTVCHAYFFLKKSAKYCCASVSFDHRLILCQMLCPDGVWPVVVQAPSVQLM